MCPLYKNDHILLSNNQCSSGFREGQGLDTTPQRNRTPHTLSGIEPTISSLENDSQRTLKYNS